MQSSTSRSPSPLPGRRAGAEDRLTAELAAVVAGARRRAARDGDRQIDTAHLLHALVEADPAVRAALGGPRAARVLAYLVQRSIGYGLRWRGTVEDFGAVPPVPDPVRSAPPPVPAPFLVPAPLRAVAAGDPPGWSPAASAALEAALDRAGARDEPRARPLDLLAGLAAVPDCRAVQVLARAGVDRARLAARIEHPSQHRIEHPSQQV
ncbi:Clp protease N-terminal domain-containing protein [Streptomyces sp. TRM76323]|uniref:Clp protease N-terminal domain-containing protein n=1 Tax=Streptomyces tamarix TaxID=3078565 RepID=A0ABU3QK71_9ACTN|nr:Clp protease N-terminal domain-containing protein [Streptomyces tamarix]MDT9683153.1 Clp protease N-terminal domain-containing protein [Streptomyces tamarix]